MSIFDNGGLFSSTIGNFIEDLKLSVEGAYYAADEKIAKRKADCYGDFELTQENIDFLRKVSAKINGQWDYENGCIKESNDEMGVGRTKENYSEEKIAYYFGILQTITNHKDFNKCNPIDIGIECGYSEEDVQRAIHMLRNIKNQQKG